MKFAIIDFETTGDSPSKDEIIQIGLVIINNMQIETVYSSFIRPSRSIPPFIQSLTGITDSMVADAPELEEVVQQILPLLADCVLVGHNISFDLSFLQWALSQSGYYPFTGRILDTMDGLRLLYPTLGSYQLSFVASSFQIPHDRPHQADCDAQATAAIWLKCVEKLLSLPLPTLKRVLFLLTQQDLAPSDLGWFIQEITAWREQQPELAHQQGVIEYRQFILAVDDWGRDEERKPSPSHPVDEDFTKFSHDLQQLLKQEIPQFEVRPAQVQMMDEITHAMHHGQHLIIEAGTGTGKSLGYLIPAIHYGLTQREKVVVSTHTINLQEQLRSKELPMLHQLSPVPFRSAILKGRNHYLCLRKFEGKVNSVDLFHEQDDRLTAAQMIIWLGETKHGDEEELHFGTKGREFWQHVASDAESCLNRSCPWFRKCYYHRARNEANEADLIVTNHSLLFTDALNEHRVLPTYERLIIDEAHHIEEIAIQHLGSECAYFPLLIALTKLVRDGRSGQLALLHTLLRNHGNPECVNLSERILLLFPEIVKLKEYWDLLFEILYAGFIAKGAPSFAENGAVTVRIRTDALPDFWQEIQNAEHQVQTVLTQLIQQLDKIMIEVKPYTDDYELESLLTNLGGTLKDLSRICEQLKFVMRVDDAHYVYWIEGNPQFKAKSVRVIAAPLDVSKSMQALFWERKDSIIMTSATLTVEQSFQYMKDQLGLHFPPHEEHESQQVQTVQLPSPFRYQEQAMVLIPRDFPTMKGSHTDPSFLQQLAQSLQEAALVTEGRMLVLFTSNKMLKQIHGILRESLKASGIHVLGQGVDSNNRSKLTRLFMQMKSAVLLGTSSFWEGVDLPGQSLICLAIVRLPFQPPNHPLVEAKSEYLRAKNINPFVKMSIPQAVIRFKQGFGRLVRTSSDRGVVLLYDTRVIENSYGKHFLRSLPNPQIEYVLTSSIPDRMKQWLFSSGN